MSAPDVYTLTNAAGLTARMSSLGASLLELWVPDRNGLLANVVLGLDHPEDYAAQSFFLGATCGRVANRIRDARFELEAVAYALEANDPPHHLHGGSGGWHRARWSAARHETSAGAAVTFSHVSPDGDAGFPGTAHAEVTYTLTDANELRIAMRARVDRASLVNLAHHSYWNLTGGGTVLAHQLKVFAGAYTPGDPVVPTGAVAPVSGTMLDYRAAAPVWPDIDHNFVVDGEPHQLRPVARLGDPHTGRTLALSSDQPGLQVYAGKFLDGSTAGHGVRHVRHAGLCLETQAFPNAINVPAWRDQVILRPGELYTHTMVHAFGWR